MISRWVKTRIGYLTVPHCPFVLFILFIYTDLNKQMTNKLRTAQRAMEKKMLDLKLKDKIPCSEIRKRTKVIDIIEYTLKQKWKWAGHIARLKDNRWTKRCTEWQPRRGKRTRG